LLFRWLACWLAGWLAHLSSALSYGLDLLCIYPNSLILFLVPAAEDTLLRVLAVVEQRASLAYGCNFLALKVEHGEDDGQDVFILSRRHGQL